MSLKLKIGNPRLGESAVKHDWPENSWTEDKPEKIDLCAAQRDNAVENMKEKLDMKNKMVINNPIGGIPKGGKREGMKK